MLRRIGEDGRVIREFVELGAKAKAAASEAMDAEATLGEIPDEFLDPIQVCFLSYLFFIFEPLLLLVCLGDLCYWYLDFVQFTLITEIDFDFFASAVHFDEGSSDLTFFEDHSGQASYSKASS